MSFTPTHDEVFDVQGLADSCISLLALRRIAQAYRAADACEQIDAELAVTAGAAMRLSQRVAAR